MAQRFEYKVDHVRQELVGDKIDTGDIEELLNDRAEDGWRLVSMETAQVKGRVGPGAVPGVVVVFERARE